MDSSTGDSDLALCPGLRLKLELSCCLPLARMARLAGRRLTVGGELGRDHTEGTCSLPPIFTPVLVPASSTLLPLLSAFSSSLFPFPPLSAPTSPFIFCSGYSPSSPDLSLPGSCQPFSFPGCGWMKLLLVLGAQIWNRVTELGKGGG